jgi:O-antigen ligase
MPTATSNPTPGPFPRLATLFQPPQTALLTLLSLGLLILPVSNAVGQIPLYLAALTALVLALRTRSSLLTAPAVLFTAAFALILLASAFISIRLDNTLDKFNRLLLFPLLLAVPLACGGANQRSSLLRLFQALLAGVVILALYDLVRIPLEVRAGTPLFHTGNMTDPQIYMIALFLLLGLRAESSRPRPLLFALLLAAILAGILLHNKRGVWLATSLTLPVWALLSRRWKPLLGLVLLGCLALALPTVRERLHNIRDNLQPRHGGRYTLWQAVAPRLLPQYPLGIGYNAGEHEDFRTIVDAVNADLPVPRRYHLEDGLRHLHNNFLQIRLELGIHGLLLWLAWMVHTLWTGFRRSPPELRPLRTATACALLALLLNGVVEYNFGDSELLMLYLTLFGILLASSQHRRVQA